MRESRFSDEQIVAVLEEHPVGLPVAEICRRSGTHDPMFYMLLAEDGGLEVSDAKRLTSLDEETAS